jgi:hypothetical protein
MKLSGDMSVPTTVQLREKLELTFIELAKAATFTPVVPKELA